MSMVSSTRCVIWAFVALFTGASVRRGRFFFALMLGHQGVNPGPVPVAQRAIVDEGELLLVAVGPQVGAALRHKTGTARPLHRHDLGVVPRRRQAGAALAAQLVD